LADNQKANSSVAREKRTPPIAVVHRGTREKKKSHCGHVAGIYQSLRPRESASASWPRRGRSRTADVTQGKTREKKGRGDIRLPPQTQADAARSRRKPLRGRRASAFADGWGKREQTPRRRDSIRNARGTGDFHRGGEKRVGVFGGKEGKTLCPAINQSLNSQNKVPCNRGKGRPARLVLKRKSREKKNVGLFHIF